MKSIIEIAKAYREGRSSPVEIVRTMLNDIENSAINAYINVFAEHALAEAKVAEAKFLSGNSLGILTGIPIAIKDLIDVAGHPTTMGAEEYANHISANDAAVVELLRRAGAIIIGKANTHQFAYGSTGDRSFFGAVKNPLDLSRMSGGSSSGSAAAVAANLAFGAIGTDTSASIRLPAALCGVVGMKATIGLVSKKGAFPLSDTLDNIGPISQDVRDNALLLEIISEKSVGHYSKKIGQDVKGLVIGIPTGFYDEYISPAVKQSMQSAIQLLEEAGAEIKSIKIENIDAIYNAQQLILKAEAYALHRASLEANAPYIDEIMERLLGGENILASDYLNSLWYKNVAQASFDKVFEEVDVLLTATCGITAPLLDERSTLINGEYHSTPWLLTRLTAPTNFSGHPSLSVPFAKDGNGMPIGLQITGRLHDEATVYQVAHQLEQFI